MVFFLFPYMDVYYIIIIYIPMAIGKLEFALPFPVPWLLLYL